LQVVVAVDVIDFLHIACSVWRINSDNLLTLSQMVLFIIKSFLL